MSDRFGRGNSVLRPFFDSNTLLYTVSANIRKAAIAESLLSEGGTISVQVLNEVANVASRKLLMSWKEIGSTLASIRNLCGPPQSLTLEIHETAVRIAARYRYHIYDALIIASALAARCDVLYSEDMQHGQLIEGLTIQNPFLP